MRKNEKFFILIKNGAFFKSAGETKKTARKKRPKKKGIKSEKVENKKQERGKRGRQNTKAKPHSATQNGTLYIIML